jgi:hypothetical protein
MDGYPNGASIAAFGISFIGKNSDCTSKRHFMKIGFDWAAGALLGAFLATFSARANAQTFSDGGTHTVNGTVTSVDVFNSGLNPTTVNIVAPADVSFPSVYDTSILNMSGGMAAHVHSYENSLFNFTGGTFSHLNVHDSSHAELSTGNGSHVRVYDHATAEIHSGSYGFASALGIFLDDNVPASPPGSVLSIYGGTVGVARASAGGTVNIFGGAASVNPFGLGTTNVYGGSITDFTLNADSETNIYGTGFLLTPNGFIHGVPQHILTGTLQNGMPINANVSLPAGAELNLILVPEPASLILALATFGFAILGARRFAK